MQLFTAKPLDVKLTYLLPFFTKMEKNWQENSIFQLTWTWTEAKAFAIDFLPHCEPVFAEYPLTDGFAFKPEYDLLYTELTGTIALMIESL